MNPDLPSQKHFDEPKPNTPGSWIIRLPRQLAYGLLAVCLVVSQLNTCDSVVSVANGDSLIFILFSFGIGFLVAMDAMLQLQSRAWSQGEQRWGGSRTAFTALCLLFCVWLWFSTTQQVGRENARLAYNGCWQWIAQILLLLSVARLCSARSVATSLFTLMMACVAGTIGYTLFQYFVSLPHDRRSFASDPDTMLSELGIAPGSSEAILYANRLGSMEPTGPFILTNSLAGFLAAWIVLLIAMLIVWQVSSQTDPNRLDGRSVRDRIHSWILPGTLSAAMLWTLFLTKSRSAWLATAIGLFLVFIVHPTLRASLRDFIRRHRMAATTLLTIGLAGVAVAWLRNPAFLAEAGRSLSYRFDYWRGAVSLLGSSPTIGYGVCNFQSNYNQVKLMTASESPADPHNFLLETACAGGYPLLMILVFLLMYVGLMLTREVALGAISNDRTHIHLTVWAEPSRWKFGELAIAIGGCFAGLGALLFHLVSSGDDLFHSVAIFVLLGIATYVALSKAGLVTMGNQMAPVCHVSALAVLIHLLASGGWMLPGVMNSAFVLMGIGLGLSSPPPTNFSKITDSHSTGRLARTPILVYAMVLLFALGAIDFARTMCLPALAKAEIVNAIQTDASPGNDPKEWLTFVEADRWDPELPRIAANACVQVLSKRSLASGTQEKWSRAFDSLSTEFLRRDPGNWIAATECGHWNFMLADVESHQGIAERELAILVDRRESSHKNFQRAAALYPSSISAQLQAAVSSAWCGKISECKNYLDHVEEIENATSHADRKLSASLVFFPKSLEKNSQALAPSARQKLEPGRARGEPVMRWLRSYILESEQK